MYTKIIIDIAPIIHDCFEVSTDNFTGNETLLDIILAKAGAHDTTSINARSLGRQMVKLGFKPGVHRFGGIQMRGYYAKIKP